MICDFNENFVCFAGNAKRQFNPSKYRSPELYNTLFQSVSVSGSGKDPWGFDLCFSQSLQSYIKVRNCNLLRSVVCPSCLMSLAILFQCRSYHILKCKCIVICRGIHMHNQDFVLEKCFRSPLFSDNRGTTKVQCCSNWTWVQGPS